MTAATPPEDRLLRLNVVAARLSVTVRTIHSWCKASRLPHVRLPSGHIRVRESVLEHHIRTGFRSPQEENAQ